MAEKKKVGGDARAKETRQNHWQKSNLIKKPFMRGKAKEGAAQQKQGGPKETSRKRKQEGATLV